MPSENPTAAPLKPAGTRYTLIEPNTEPSLLTLLSLANDVQSTRAERVVALAKSDSEMLESLINLHGNLTYNEDDARTESWARDKSHPIHELVATLAQIRASLSHATAAYATEISRLRHKLDGLRTY